MRKTSIQAIFFLAFTAIMILVSCGSGNSGHADSGKKFSPGDTASIHFSEYEHDFGKVASGEKVVSVFTYENRGTIPLVIESASTSCGCTVSKYSTEPLAPGKSGTLEVTFDSEGRSGKQTKTITIRSNATRPIVLLRIKGEVTLDK
jgi:hypothetical protein